MRLVSRRKISPPSVQDYATTADNVRHVYERDQSYPCKFGSGIPPLDDPLGHFPWLPLFKLKRHLLALFLTLTFRPTTRERVHLATRGYFRSRDKDNVHTIRSVITENPMLHETS